jgi:hypothetical protein
MQASSNAQGDKTKAIQTFANAGNKHAVIRYADK